MAQTPRLVLSIDWDFFTGDCNETDPCALCLWDCDREKRLFFPSKIVGGKSELREDHNPFNCSPKPYQTYKDIFACSEVFGGLDIPAFFKGARFVAADCHASLYSLLEEEDHIFDIDYHYDYSQPGHRLTCANWAARAVRDKKCKHEWVFAQPIGTSPQEREQPTLERLVDFAYEPISLVFLCLSRPYTPPLLDTYFWMAVNDLQQVTRTEPEFIGLGARTLRRQYRKAG